MPNGQPPPTQGRSRGRARGRARAQPIAEQPLRRPGEEVTSRPQPPVQEQPPTVTSGRAIHRGAVSRPGAEPGVERIGRELGELQLGGPTPGEGALAASGRGRSRGGKREIYEPVTRPEHVIDKRGGEGKPIMLYANFFQLESRPNWRIYQYRVDFAPVVESSRMRRGMLHDHKELFGAAYIFDGMSDLMSLTKLDREETEVYSKRRTDDANITINIKRVAELAPNHPEVNRLFNIQMRRNLQHLEYVQLGRRFFDKKDVTSIPQHGIELWAGVLTSIQEHDSGILMCVDTIHKTLRTDTVLDQMKKITEESPRNYQDACVKELAGSIVMTGYNNRTYRIEDIDWTETPRSTFEMRNEQTSYVDYYNRHYGIKIRDHQQPLLICKSKQRELRSTKTNILKLIPELCCMTGLTDDMRADTRVMKDLSSHTRLNPGKRIENLLTFIDRINKNENIKKEMNGWGIRFSRELVSLESRVLMAERIIHYNGEKSTYDPSSANFTREMRGKRMFSSVSLHNWAILVTDRDKPRAIDFVQNLCRVGPPMGMNISQPMFHLVENERTHAYLTSIREVVSSSPSIQILVIIVPNNRKDRYDAIKKMTYIDMPVPSQVIVSRNLAKKQMLMSLCTKVGIQMNCKLGGEPWAVEIPLKTLMMVIGFDSYHDSARKGQSVGGFVASLNNSLTRWYSQVSFHQTGGWQELSDSLTVHTSNALKKYHSINGALPQIIIFYRDGVSEGQINHVVSYELAQIQRVLASLSEAPFRLSFIIVNKRISARFFVKNAHPDNPPPGTVVDSVVTRPTRYDFYLVSQSVMQGTVTPTLYNVIYDTSGFKPKIIQMLTYKLAHLYFNWSGTIRVPACCQFAHKLAFLTGQSLHKETAERLADTLFYL